MTTRKGQVGVALAVLVVLVESLAMGACGDEPHPPPPPPPASTAPGELNDKPNVVAGDAPSEVDTGVTRRTFIAGTVCVMHSSTMRDAVSAARVAEIRAMAVPAGWVEVSGTCSDNLPSSARVARCEVQSRESGQIYDTTYYYDDRSAVSGRPACDAAGGRWRLYR